MRHTKTLALLLALVAGNAAAASESMPPRATVTDLTTKILADYPGKEILVINVDYPPGAVDPIHRHDAHAIVYVVEGSIVMGVKGQKEQVLKPGDTFYEGPNDIHTIGRNASQTKPAKFIVFLLKNEHAPVLVPVH
ncbi:MAG: cupin domain-containing protein [Luteibacter sp.]